MEDKLNAQVASAAARMSAKKTGLDLLKRGEANLEECTAALEGVEEVLGCRRWYVVIRFIIIVYIRRIYNVCSLCSLLYLLFCVLIIFSRSICESGQWGCIDVDCEASCSVIGNGHTTTFDGKQYDLPDSCSSVLSEDCSRNKKWKVSVLNLWIRTQVPESCTFIVILLIF